MTEKPIKTDDMSDADFKELEQLYELREQLVEMVGKITDLEGKKLDLHVSHNLDDLASIIVETGFSNEKVKEFIYEIEDNYYSTKIGQKALLDKFIQESKAEYDEYESIGYTNYIKFRRYSHDSRYKYNGFDYGSKSKFLKSC